MHRIVIVGLSLLPLLYGQRSYQIFRASSPIQIDARLDEAAWREAPAVGDFHFNWYSEGDKEQTSVKMLWDDENLYAGYRVSDRHISASVTQRHGPVSQDDCVEIFVAPNPGKIRNYYVFEINAIGAMLNQARTDWWTGGLFWEPEGVRYRTTFHGLAKKVDSTDDSEWIVELAIPLKNFARDAEHMPPRDGDTWRLNLNRLGGTTNKQYSSWSPISTEKPNFHTPDSFGTVRFVNSMAQRTVSRRGGRERGQNPLGKGAEVITAGRTLYNRSCTMCHGLDGAAGDRAPALAGARRFLRRTDRDIYDAIHTGVPGTAMPAIPLPETDVWKVVAYIQALRATAVDDVVGGDPAAGAQLFWGKANCGGCHTIRGRGGAVGPDLSDIGGSRTVAVLKETLTKEPAFATRGFQQVTVKLKSGATITGAVKNEHNFSMQLLDKTNRLHLLTSDEIASVTPAERTPMPRDFDKRLSKDEFQNLIAFLARQTRSRESAVDEENER